MIPEAAWLIEARLGPAAEARFLTLVTSDRFTGIDPPAEFEAAYYSHNPLALEAITQPEQLPIPGRFNGLTTGSPYVTRR